MNFTNKQKTLLTFVLAFALVALAAVTQIDLTTQVKGVLPTANGGTGQNSTATFPSSGTIVSAGSALTSGQLIFGGGSGLVAVGNLTGDATTSGTSAVTVVKVNGTSVPTNSAADQIVVTTASATGAWKTIPDCQTGAIQYTQSTHTVSCGSVLTGAFADNETPTGTVNGVNTVFTLAFTPNPSASLHFHKNGQLMYGGGADYTLSTNTVTFVAGAIPKTGDVVSADYRH